MRNLSMENTPEFKSSVGLNGAKISWYIAGGFSVPSHSQKYSKVAKGANRKTKVSLKLLMFTDYSSPSA